MSLQLGMYVPLPVLVLPAPVARLCCQLPPLLLPAGHSMLPGSPVPPVALLEDVVAVREVDEFIIIMVGKADVGSGGRSGGGEGSWESNIS